MTKGSVSPGRSQVRNTLAMIMAIKMPSMYMEKRTFPPIWVGKKAAISRL